MHGAAENGSMACLKQLIEAGANVEAVQFVSDYRRSFVLSLPATRSVPPLPPVLLLIIFLQEIMDTTDNIARRRYRLTLPLQRLLVYLQPRRVVDLRLLWLHRVARQQFPLTSRGRLPYYIKSRGERGTNIVRRRTQPRVGRL